ncbi:hypothetical protein ON010_g1004 [Phytophthora cinnamomi]|nr:hypothetical protein ON010_g1004 [Phytophthora cinnamomi]
MENRVMTLEYVPTQENPADFMTKALSRPELLHKRGLSGLSSVSGDGPGAAACGGGLPSVPNKSSPPECGLPITGSGRSSGDADADNPGTCSTAAKHVTSLFPVGCTFNLVDGGIQTASRSAVHDPEALAGDGPPSVESRGRQGSH